VGSVARERQPGMAESDEYLIGRVQRALALDPRLNELHLDVHVSARRVFVTGEVATEERRQAVEEVVTRRCPGHEVHVHVTVVPVSAEPGREDIT
jgi:osmotically-inducible protein OsmY